MVEMLAIATRQRNANHTTGGEPQSIRLGDERISYVSLSRVRGKAKLPLHPGPAGRTEECRVASVRPGSQKQAPTDASREPDLPSSPACLLGIRWWWHEGANVSTDGHEAAGLLPMVHAACGPARLSQPAAVSFLRPSTT